MAKLSQDEVIEAIIEWAEKRGLPVDITDKEDIELCVFRNTDSLTLHTGNSACSFYANIKHLDMPIKNGPYR